MKVEFETGPDIFVDFEHMKLIPGQDHTIMPVPLYSVASHRTKCIITNVDGQIISEATSFCSTKDNFCKETGRKIALKRALSSAGHSALASRFHYHARKTIWQAYFNRGSSVASPTEALKDAMTSDG